MDSNPRPPNERLVSLKEAARSKDSPVRRAYETLREWANEGAENLSGDRVKLETWPVGGARHTTFEALQRFITAQGSLTARCEIIGGCMDGKARSISDHIDRITTAQLKPDCIGAADELYHHRRFIDSRGKLRHFLVWVGVEEADEVIRQRLEAE